jgi:S-adenosylmethionine:tRNA ribosyltransferase-isomerase
MDLAHFRYELPDEAIAQQPVEPRDAARLLDARELSDHYFRDLPDLLAPGDLVVVNTTRVRRARLVGQRAGTGGAVELLLLHRRPEGGWRALVSPSRRIRTGVELAFGPVRAIVTDDPVDGVVSVAFEDESLMDQVGTVPLPPYIRRELADPERYQTVYSETTGSAAAPTAGLHFTDGLLRRLAERGIERAAVELRVGLGTFRPITVDRIEDHEMHREWCAVPEATSRAIDATRRRGGRVVAVGTTTVRTLETFARPDGTVGHGHTETDLFLRPGSTFHAVNLLVTNFHVPGSSLLVMLAAFMGDGWVEAYRVALQRRYRFLSLGDAMLCERSG